MTTYHDAAISEDKSRRFAIHYLNAIRNLTQRLVNLEGMMNSSPNAAKNACYLANKAFQLGRFEDVLFFYRHLLKRHRRLVD